MTQQREPANPEPLVQLPLIGSVAIYARAAAQDKPTESQVDSLKQLVSTLGYSQEQITIFADNGEAAAAPLLEREGYRALLSAMKAGSVNVVVLREEARIFADADALQVNTFIHLCIDKSVFVITPHTVYDFQNPAHVALFRFQCESANLYTQGAIQQRMTREQ